MTGGQDNTLPFQAPAFRAALAELLAWRRDVRRFRSEPLADGVLEGLLATAALAPSVGLSQPWRFVRLASGEARAAARANFEAANAAALAGYGGEDAARYARLKLSGLDHAAEQLAVFCDADPAAGRGLGRATMPQMLDYSVVAAIHTLWLAARAQGIGLGWVSILDPAQLSADLAVPPGWRLIALLCLGYPEEEGLEPELQAAGWERRAASPLLER